MIISGTGPDGELVEAIELPKSVHPFFVGTNFIRRQKSAALSAPGFCGVFETMFVKKSTKQFKEFPSGKWLLMVRLPGFLVHKKFYGGWDMYCMQ